MNADPRQRAERCFALARSTTFDGERANAIAQGTRIAETAGLSLDLFDIPGRVRGDGQQPRQATHDQLFAYTIHRPDGTPVSVELSAAFEAMAEALARANSERAAGRCLRCGGARVRHGFFSVCERCR